MTCSNLLMFFFLQGKRFTYLYLYTYIMRIMGLIHKARSVIKWCSSVHVIILMLKWSSKMQYCCPYWCFSVCLLGCCGWRAPRPCSSFSGSSRVCPGSRFCRPFWFSTWVLEDGSSSVCLQRQYTVTYSKFSMFSGLSMDWNDSCINVKNKLVVSHLSHWSEFTLVLIRCDSYSNRFHGK